MTSRTSTAPPGVPSTRVGSPPAFTDDELLAGRLVKPRRAGQWVSAELFQSEIAPVLRREIPSRPLTTR